MPGTQNLGPNSIGLVVDVLLILFSH
jgi:hypothetical protein